MIVLDASAALEWLTRTTAGASIASYALGRGPFCAPHLLDLEIASALRRQCQLGAMSPERAHEALIDLQAMPLIRHPHGPFLERIWELRENFTAYDAVYLALAEALDATLLTCDRALASARLRSGRVEAL